LLGDVLLALERRPILAGLSRRAAAGASEPDGGGSEEGAGVQFSALPLPGDRSLHPARGLRAWPGGSARAGGPPRGPRISVWAEAAQRRRRHLRVHRQYPVLSDRNTVEAVRGLATRSGAPLHRPPRRRRRAIARQLRG